MFSCRELIVGFLSDRTRVLVSHNLSLTVPQADTVICIDSSYQKIVACSPPAELEGVLRANKTLVSPLTGGLSAFWESLILITSAASSASNGLGSSQSGIISSPTANKSSKSAEGTIESRMRSSSVNHSMRMKSSGSFSGPPKPDRKRGESLESMTDIVIGGSEASVDSATDISTSVSNDVAKGHKNIVDTETKNTGDIGWDVYWYYAKSGGGAIITTVFILCFVWITLSK